MQVPRQGWSQWPMGHTGHAGHAGHTGHTGHTGPAPQAKVVHQVMPQNGQMNVQNVPTAHRPNGQMPAPNAAHAQAAHTQQAQQAQQAHPQAAHAPHAQAQAQHAASFPALPVTLSRQHLPEREPGAFTPPAAASMGSFVARMGESTPTSRAKSPEVIQAHGQMVIKGMSGKSPPRMPNPKASLGALPGSARNTPRPQPRPVVSFVPNVRSSSPSREERSPSPEARKCLRDPSCDRDHEKRHDGRRVEFRPDGWREDGRDRRLSRSEDSIPEEPPRLSADQERAAKWERELLLFQEKLRAREQRVCEREQDLVTREKRVADREADLAKMFDRLTEREEQHRQECQVRTKELALQKEELQAESLELKNRCADLDCRNADLDQREVKLKTEEDRCKELKRNLDERDARWHEAAKDATVILKPHLKPRLSPRGKENLELQRQLEEQRGLMHKIKRKQDSWGDGEENSRCHRDSFGSEETVAGHGHF